MNNKLIDTHSLKLAIIWSIVIFILCCTPGQYIPSSNWLELLSFDKFVHASIFFVLTLLWLLVLRKHQYEKSNAVVIVFISCVVYGGLLEIMQAKVFSNRSGDWLDFIANTFGCVCALFIFYKRKISTNA